MMMINIAVMMIIVAGEVEFFDDVMTTSWSNCMIIMMMAFCLVSVENNVRIKHQTRKTRADRSDQTLPKFRHFHSNLRHFYADSRCIDTFLLLFF